MSRYNGGSHQWNEKEWQAYVNRLLGVHHSLLDESYQRVPDISGDHGLEGFSNSGVAYQAYADQGSKSTADRKEKQKGKIYDDLPKLKKYESFWQKMLQGQQIHEWVLVVPLLEDKDVVKYAREKGAEIKALGLPFIANDFHVTVKTADDFARAQQLLETMELSADALKPKPVTDEQTEDFQSNQPEFVQNLEQKLAKVFPTDPTCVTELKDKLLARHLESENLLDDLRDRYPILWEGVDELIQSTGLSVSTEGPFDTRPSKNRLTETRREFADKLRATNKFLRPKHIEAVSWGAIASWIGECPLDFPEPQNA